MIVLASITGAAAAAETYYRTTSNYGDSGGGSSGRYMYDGGMPIIDSKRGVSGGGFLAVGPIPFGSLGRAVMEAFNHYPSVDLNGEQGALQTDKLRMDEHKAMMDSLNVKPATKPATKNKWQDMLDMLPDDMKASDSTIENTADKMELWGVGK